MALEDYLAELEELDGEELDIEEEEDLMEQEELENLAAKNEQDHRKEKWSNQDLAVSETKMAEAGNTDDGQQNLKKSVGGSSGVADSFKIAKVYKSKEFGHVIDQIKLYTNTVDITKKKIFGPVEEDDEYKLVVRANELSIKIEGEIVAVYRNLRDLYAVRFPELETLVTNPLSYAQTILAIGESIDIDIGKVKLDGILAPAIKMVVVVTGSTTSGRKLEDDELQQVLKGAQILIQLIEAKDEIVKYVESRMGIIAPNLSAIVGPAIAARMIVDAEGLTGLAKIPACNLQVLGKQRQYGTGMSSVTAKKHVGLLYESELVSSVPDDFKNKMLRKVAAKCALAIRVDMLHEAADGGMGTRFKQELLSSVEKLLEPAPLKAIKPLVIPPEGRKIKRAGKRVRREKESTAMTELRKNRNRMYFGKASEEVVVNDEMENLGMLGQGGSGGLGMGMGMGITGKIRGISTDTSTSKKIKPSKKYQRILQQQSQSSAVSGIATNLSFTPIQGIELSNPKTLLERQNKVDQANSRYFSGGFMSAIPKK
ncbi:U4/U6 small nuclear ribonucleoprotein Prp31 [Zancudomyces culisetae]|uniref:U4/U6 small nuclear ribonucleoprotein Prp31 n=1 Tax=Zancudomyces culisetae TaxID=1213189 RepID=A0A1R1PF25_ZANCU|nr:U4/U6 small nuclear ribonucleoprotein Prp31 [Zancudomyces culisetae]|eukprot:OMH79518.1 U4/U6 small nuclear ribonucleoprotein Prp31 [Zancudomyces culisetae]